MVMFLVDNVPIVNQVFVSQINPKLPLEPMIPFIHRSFVLARVNNKNDKNKDLSENKSRGTLEKLRELELK